MYLNSAFGPRSARPSYLTIARSRSSLRFKAAADYHGCENLIYPSHSERHQLYSIYIALHVA
jgi:hypothetical protein